MFSRFVSLTLKPNAGQDFTNAFASTVLPILRAQPGFRDELLFVTPGGPEMVAVSLWDSQADADKYSRSAYPDILNALANFIDGTPKVETYLVPFSSAHKVELGEMPVQSPNTTPIPGVGGG